MQDNELLREYLESRSEAAFAELVRRYTGLVFSTARRKLGDLNLADDVSQTVFSLLVHKAGSLRNVPTLAGWLYRTTCFTAAKALRTEMRRRRHEQLALEMNEPDTNTNKIWEQLAPLLDEGMASLAEKDRLALLLRFFQREPMRTVGDALGISEAAAKMRVGRSVERLREFFVRRGLLCSTSGLAALLSERASEAAPPYLPTKLTAAALSVSSGSGPLFLTQILARLASFRVMPLFLGGVSAA